MSFLGDLFNPVSAVQDTWSGLASLPGTPEALGSGIYGGLNGGLSWNPYSQDNSVWDTGAGGTELSQDPRNRQAGRTIGTAIGAAFTGGALAGAEGGAAEGAGSSALGIGAGTESTTGAAELSLGSQGAIDAGAAGYGAGGGLAAFQNGAVRGGVNGVASGVSQGGDGNDILKRGALGAVTGGIGGAVNSYNPSGQAGVTNPAIQRAINSGIVGGVGAASNGSSVGQGFLSGAVGSGINSAGNGISNYFKGGNKVALNDSYAGATPDGEAYPNEFAQSAPASAASSENGGFSFGDHPFGQFLGSLVGNGGLGQIANGALATYSALDARRRYNNATNSINDMYAPNSPYATQMAQGLARKDAAAGRNSQYGARSVQLAAALTNGRAQALTSPGYGNLLGQQQKAYGQLPITAAAMLQSNWGKGLVGQGSQQLSNFFAGNNNPNYGNEGMHNPVSTTPAWDDGLIPGQ